MLNDSKKSNAFNFDYPSEVLTLNSAKHYKRENEKLHDTL
jgi:hypothetical protein